MWVSEIKEEDLTVETVDRLLFQGLEDPGDAADCILVLGSTKAAEYRVPVAVEAYRNGRAGKIMMCGGVLRAFPEGMCREAAHMCMTALEAGVAEADLILEDSSQNTVENILFAMVQLQRAFRLNQVRKVLLVTTAYHMRRSLAIARYLFPAHMTVIPCPANDRNTREDNWMHTSVGIARAKGEAMKLVQYVVSGVIPDFEIETGNAERGCENLSRF